MLKRPLADNDGERRKSKRLTAEGADGMMDEAFTETLTSKVFVRRPTRVQKCAIQYITEMRLNPRPSVEGYLSHVQAAHLPSKVNFGAAWNKLKEFFSSSDPATYSDIEDMTNVQALVDAFKAQRCIQPTQPGSVPSTRPQASMSSASSNNVSRSSSSRSSNSRSSNRSSGSGSSSKSSGFSLNSTLLAQLRLNFEANWDAFKGEPWTLPSGAALDDLLRGHVVALDYESTMHSCIISDVDEVLRLTTDPRDQQELERMLCQPRDDSLWSLPDAELQYLQLYDKPPAVIETMLKFGYGTVLESAKAAATGPSVDADTSGSAGPNIATSATSAAISATPTITAGSSSQVPSEEYCALVHELVNCLYRMYRRNEFTLPGTKSKSWYQENVWIVLHELLNVEDTISYTPGEYHSRASGEYKWAGRGIHGVIVSVAPQLGLGAVKATEADHAGPNSAEALHGRLKLAKTMKDQFDEICDASAANIDKILAASPSLERPNQTPLTTYGLLVSGGSISFYSLQHRRGRFYQLCCEGTATPPSVWTSDGRTTARILSVVSSLLCFRRQTMAMASIIDDLMHVGFQLPPASGTNIQSRLPATIVTPNTSPRLRPATIFTTLDDTSFSESSS
ncbi:hypothetical protein DFQ27_002599 [Actinomortierella ambigua]|uniref:Uncharacterized protein n=1 Tax=Actinomortierella ambigua TaxID=1343610 RepID=A0A9P6UDC8_9FUNG|nr:hypothetical protein DFQ27_002599 [Actinomortierella ambigua]